MTDVLLGHDNDTREKVFLTEEGRKLSTYIIGTIGTGKSTLLEQIAIQDMQNGDGICFLDPHEDAAERLLLYVPDHRKDDVIYWNPSNRQYPFGLNPFFCSDGEEIDTKADNFIAALGSLAEFAEVFEAAPRMKDVMLHMAIAFIANQGKTLAETPLFLTNETYRKLFYPALDRRYPQIRYYWEEFDNKSDRSRDEQVGSTLNKVRRFQANNTLRNIFGQPTNAIDFREVMDERKIIIVKLNSQRLGADNAAFIGAFIVWEIFQAALSRVDTPEKHRPQFHLLADEFQTYMTTAFPSLIEQVRKFNVDITVAHQRRDQLPFSSRNAPLVAGNKVVFTITGHDAQELAKEFRIVIPEPDATGQQPKYSIAPNPLEHLKTHGHVDSKVVGQYNRLMNKIGEYYDLLSKILTTREENQQRNRQSPYSRIFPPTDNEPVTSASYRGLDQSKQRAVDILDQLLYLMMTSQNVEFFKLTYTAGGVAITFNENEEGSSKYKELQEELYDELESISYGVIGPKADLKFNIHFFLLDVKKVHKHAIGVHEDCIRFQKEDDFTPELIQKYVADCKSLFTLQVIKYNKDWDAFSHKFKGSSVEWEYAWEIVTMIDAIPESCIELGQYLSEKPAVVPTGQYEPVLEKPRLYSDVEAEIANTLATLPRFAARCKLLQDGQANEYTITTFDRPKPEIGAESTAQEIKRNSCTLYGRDRAEVEEEIARRLRTTPAPAPRPEPPDQPEQESLDLWEEEG